MKDFKTFALRGNVLDLAVAGCESGQDFRKDDASGADAYFWIFFF